MTALIQVAILAILVVLVVGFWHGLKALYSIESLLEEILCKLDEREEKAR